MHYNQFINDILLYISEEESGGKIGGIQLAQAIREITEFEIEEGGPYSFEPQCGLMSADIGLNLAIACFLALQDVRLPKLDAYIKEQLAQEPDSFTSILDDKTIIELVTKYENANYAAKENLARPQRQITYDQEEQRMMDAILKRFDERFASFYPKLRERAKGAIKKTIKGNRDKQMSLMAYYTKIALGKAGENIEDDLIADLGLANIFFWTAFIIYDDFWDRDEAADPHLLPIANIFSRYYIDFYTNLADGKNLGHFSIILWIVSMRLTPGRLKIAEPKLRGIFFISPRHCLISEITKINIFRQQAISLARSRFLQDSKICLKRMTGKILSSILNIT